MDLDASYAYLSERSRRAVGHSLAVLANRAPTEEPFEMYDLERLLGYAIDWGDYPFAGLSAYVFGTGRDQRLGYLSAIETMCRLGHFTDPGTFRRKFIAPKESRARPDDDDSQMLDTLAECLYGQWFHCRGIDFDYEAALPGGKGDVDFKLLGGDPLWVDVVSPQPNSDVADAADYIANTVRRKWRKKFGRREGARDVPSGIAVLLLKSQEHLMSDLIRCEITGQSIDAPTRLWDECPSLQRVWIATPGFDRHGTLDMLAVWGRKGTEPAEPDSCDG